MGELDVEARRFGAIGGGAGAVSPRLPFLVGIPKIYIECCRKGSVAISQRRARTRSSVKAARAASRTHPSNSAAPSEFEILTG
jgi:hypothetical protein